MSGKTWPACPSTLKHIQNYLRTAMEHEERDIVVSYWCRLYALQMGLKTDRSSPEAKRLLAHLMDWLEKVKSEESDNEAISSDLPAQSHLENYALRLFIWADSQDRIGTHNKNVVKAFFTAGLIYDVLDTFGEVSEEILQNKRYSKWKATYIHNCLKNGQVPVPGPLMSEENVPERPPSIRDSIFRGGSLSDDDASHMAGISSVSGMRPGRSSTVTGISKEPKPETSSAKNVHITGETAGIVGAKLNPDQMGKAQKYCKWAASALNYDDVPTAIVHLQKALKLLTTGVEE